MFDQPVSKPMLTNVDVDFVGPPTHIAVVTLAVGLVSVLMAALTTGTAGWGGYVIGFIGVLSGIGYRWVLRARQIEPMFLPNHIPGRIMLTGVLISFGGIAWNAFHIAQRTIN